MSHFISTAIIGASGYTGAELIRLLHNHPHVRIAALTGDTQAGKEMAEVYPHLTGQGLPPLTTLAEVDFNGIDLAFCCLPHGATRAVVAALPEHVRVIDLSADFRLFDAALYEKWYGHAHLAMHLQGEAVYGLSEHARADIAKARLIANPGCYPTSALLPLIPLLKTRHILPGGIIVDAKSGVTGAGRSPKQSTLFTEINEGISVYGVGNHRHTPEIEQSLGWAAKSDVRISFTPHLVPMNRGILSTIYVTLASPHTVDDIRNVWQHSYGHEPFVKILPTGIMPATHMVRGTNNCVMNIFESAIAGQAIIVCAIDNLVKGASGQAVQNMNIMFGWPEITGLPSIALFP